MRKPSLLARLGIYLCLGIAGCVSNPINPKYASVEKPSTIELSDESKEYIRSLVKPYLEVWEDMRIIE